MKKFNPLNRMPSPKSITYKSGKACPSGFHKRTGYTRRTGTYVPAACVRSTTTYKESSREFKGRVAKTQKAFRKSHGLTAKRTIKCPAGMVPRANYARHFTTAVREQGYIVRRKSGKSYRVYPKKMNYTHIKQACIKDKGLPGSPAPGERFTPLRKGELKKHGYVYREKEPVRRAALKKAVAEFGALGVYRKLNAVAKLAKRTAPNASRIFKSDRNWVHKTFSPTGHLSAF